MHDREGANSVSVAKLVTETGAAFLLGRSEYGRVDTEAQRRFRHCDLSAKWLGTASIVAVATSAFSIQNQSDFCGCDPCALAAECSRVGDREAPALGDVRTASRHAEATGHHAVAQHPEPWKAPTDAGDLETPALALLAGGPGSRLRPSPARSPRLWWSWRGVPSSSINSICSAATGCAVVLCLGYLGEHGGNSTWGASGTEWSCSIRTMARACVAPGGRFRRAADLLGEVFWVV
jgi:hypothetical protein